ncbi:MAG: hypothetical protein AAGG48_08695 [Planctomycetota bacterium]
MNCDRFEDRMNELLDRHESVADDATLQAHASYCECCHQKLMIWQQIDGITPLVSQEEPADRNSWSRIAVLAAGIALAIVLTWNYQRERFTTVQVSPNPAASAQVESRIPSPASQLGIDPNQWWQSVEPGQWIAQTMPTVRTVQESVEPLRRSFQQAVDLLTFGRAT